MLFCATAVFARVPTADAYTVIVASSSNGGGDHWAYAYFFWGYNRGPDVSRSTIEQLALKICRSHGGINPKIVLSTGKPGYFAIAVSGQVPKEQYAKPSIKDATQKCWPWWQLAYWGTCGWAGPLPSPEAAANEAIAKCKERGGTDPHICLQLHDYYHR